MLGRLVGDAHHIWNHSHLFIHKIVVPPLVSFCFWSGSHYCN
jgi:hypothetical protein